MFWKHFLFLTLVAICVAHNGRTRSSGKSNRQTTSQKSSSSRPVINIDSSLIERPLTILGSLLGRIIRPADNDNQEITNERTNKDDNVRKSKITYVSSNNRNQVTRNNELDYSESEEEIIPVQRLSNTNNRNNNDNTNRNRNTRNNLPDYPDYEEDIPTQRQANTNIRRIKNNITNKIRNTKNNFPNYPDSEEDVTTQRPANTNGRRNRNNNDTTNRNQNTRNNVPDYPDSEEDIPIQRSSNTNSRRNRNNNDST